VCSALPPVSPYRRRCSCRLVAVNAIGISRHATQDMQLLERLGMLILNGHPSVRRRIVQYCIAAAVTRALVEFSDLKSVLVVRRSVRLPFINSQGRSNAWFVDRLPNTLQDRERGSHPKFKAWPWCEINRRGGRHPAGIGGYFFNEGVPSAAVGPGVGVGIRVGYISIENGLGSSAARRWVSIILA
jgi:hypothetical protein